MAYVIPPEYFVYALEAYFSGWYVPVDLFFYILFFGGISKVALKDKFGKLLPLAFTFAFAFSLVLVEVGTGINLFQWSWIAILVGSCALWFWLYKFFSNALSIPENNLTPEQKKYKLLIIALTGLISGIVFLVFIGAFGQMALQGKAAGLHMAWDAGPVAKSLDMILKVFQLVLGVVVVGVVFFVVGLARHGPFAAPGASVAQVSEATNTALQELKKAIEKLADQTREGFELVAAKLVELKDAIPKIADLANTINAALERYKNEFFTPLNTTIGTIAASVQESKEVLKTHKEALDKIPGELGKIEGWITAAVDRLNSELGKVSGAITALPNLIAAITATRDSASERVAGFERTLGEQKAAHERLLSELEKRVRAEGDVRVSEVKLEAEKKIAADLSSAKVQIDALTGRITEMKTSLDILNGIVKDLKEKAATPQTIDVNAITTAIQKDKDALIAALATMSDALAKASRSKKPQEVVNIIGGNFFRGRNAGRVGDNSVVMPAMTALQQSLSGGAENLTALEHIVQLVMTGSEKKKADAAVQALETTAVVVTTETQKIGETLGGAEKSLAAAKAESAQDKNAAAVVVSSLEKVREDVVKVEKDITSLLNIETAIIGPIIKLHTNMFGKLPSDELKLLARADSKERNKFISDSSNVVSEEFSVLVLALQRMLKDTIDAQTQASTMAVSENISNKINTAMTSLRSILSKTIPVEEYLIGMKNSDKLVMLVQSIVAKNFDDNTGAIDVASLRKTCNETFTTVISFFAELKASVSAVKNELLAEERSLVA